MASATTGIYGYMFNKLAPPYFELTLNKLAEFYSIVLTMGILFYKQQVTTIF
jgi:hypothetical protein